MHYLSISLTICFSIVFISVLSLSLSILPVSLSLSHILFLFFSHHFNDVITSWGPHRLVVRTSRCGRDNPGSTPGVDIWYVWRSCIIRHPFATSNILRSLPFRCHRIFLLPCSPFVLLQISAVRTISPLFYFLSFFLSFVSPFYLMIRRNWKHELLSSYFIRHQLEANCKWPQRDSNSQPSDLESDALPLRHTANCSLHFSLTAATIGRG